MYLIDTHCHLHDREFFTEAQAEEMLENARTRGIEQIICIGTSHEDSLSARQFAETHSNIFWTYGTHPESADRYVIDCKKADKLVAIGEIGLDYHYPGYDRQKQIKLLEEMLDLAIKLGLPCSFHVREAFDDFFTVVKNFTGLKPSVLHSFTDSKESLDHALNQGFYIGINGILVNHATEFDWTNDLRNTLPLDRIVLETDAPFLTPAPNRGKINEPGNVADVASWLAKKIGVSREEIAEWTTKNARTIFNLPHPNRGTGARA